MTRRASPEDHTPDAGGLFDSRAAWNAKPMQEARDRGELGAARAASKAERLDAAWKAECLEELRRFAEAHAEPFLAETVTLAVPPGADPRAVGHIFQAARRAGLIRPVGYAPSSHSNGSPKVLWSSCIVQVPSASPART